MQRQGQLILDWKKTSPYVYKAKYNGSIYKLKKGRGAYGKWEIYKDGEWIHGFYHGHKEIDQCLLDSASYIIEVKIKYPR